MGPRKEAKDSRKICERGVPGNFYLAQPPCMSQVMTVLWHASKLRSNVCPAQYTTSLYFVPHYWIIVRTCMCMIYMQQWDSSHPSCWIHDQRPGNLSMESWRTTLRSSNVSAWWRSLWEWESGSGGLWSNLVASQLWTFSRNFFKLEAFQSLGIPERSRSPNYQLIGWKIGNIQVEEIVHVECT